MFVEVVVRMIPTAIGRAVTVYRTGRVCAVRHSAAVDVTRTGVARCSDVVTVDRATVEFAVG